MAQIKEPAVAHANLPSADHQYVKCVVFEDDREVTILVFERFFYAR
jgi:hypothetical protein